MDGLRKVQPGDALQIPAKAYNAFVDAALDHQKRRMSTSGDALHDKDQANIVLVKNESGAARSRFDVLGITGPIIARADSAATFQSRIALRGVTPTAAHVGRFLVLVDAIPHGTIGRAYVAGACLSRVRMLDEAHTAADVDDGQAGRLASGTSGSAALLWVEPVGERDDPAIAWAVIRFGGGAGSNTGGADPSGDFILALLKGVQRFSADNPDLPAYHWKQAQITTEGAAEEVPTGLGSKTIPSCDQRTVVAEDASYSVLADPAAEGDNLTDAVVDDVTETLTFRITGTQDTTHTVTNYRILVGTSFTDLSYGASAVGSLPPGSTPTLLLTGIPLDTDLYVRMRTNTTLGAQNNQYILRVGINGSAQPQITVSTAYVGAAPPAGTDLVSPVTAEYSGTITDGVTDLPIDWLPATGATHYYVTVGSGLGNWNDADGDTYDIYDPGGETTSTALTIPDLPVDGVTRYLYIGWRTSPAFDWQYNAWAISLTPAADRRAINVEDVNRIVTESQVGLTGLTEIPDPPTEGEEPDVVELETELDVPILVKMWRTTDAAGNDRFVFEHVEQEFIGEIVAHAPSEWTDPRYDVKLVKVSNAGAKDEAVTLTDGTGAAARTVTATNLAEIAAGTHVLPVGTAVVVRPVRGGDKPWITRYVFSAGTGSLVVGTPHIYVDFIANVTWNNSTCTLEQERHWLEFVPVIIDGETYYLFKQELSEDPT